MIQNISMMKNIIIFFLLFVFLLGPVQAECIDGDCENNIGTKILGEDSKYIGSFKNGLFDGKGIYILNKKKNI